MMTRHEPSKNTSRFKSKIPNKSVPLWLIDDFQMTFNLSSLSPADRYRILASLVTPRPIAWVTTSDGEGHYNTAPFSFFNVFGSNPPLVAFAPGNKDRRTPKDTALNIRSNQQFVVHMVDEALSEIMVESSASLPYGTDELEDKGLTYLPCDHISVPRISEAPVALECMEHSTLEIGTNRLVIGIVHVVHVREGLMSPEGHLHEGVYHPIARMASPNWYARTVDQFEISHPD